MITVTFDPEDVMSIGDFARGAGVTLQAARSWVTSKQHDGTIPKPLFILDLGTRGKMPIWAGDEGRAAVKHYTKVRRVRS